MRRLVALVLSLAIPVAALAAPLVHVHPDGHNTAHHRGATIHAHWAGHGHGAGAGHSHGAEPHDHASAVSASTAVDGVERHRALVFDAYVAVTPAAVSTPGVVPAAVVLPVPAERAAHPNVDVTHGHDPPYGRLLPARAPPSFLS